MNKTKYILVAVVAIVAMYFVLAERNGQNLGAASSIVIARLPMRIVSFDGPIPNFFITEPDFGTLDPIYWGQISRSSGMATVWVETDQQGKDYLTSNRQVLGEIIVAHDDPLLIQKVKQIIGQ